MTDAERLVNEQADPMYECPTCNRREPTELFLMWCCSTDEEHGRGIYRGIN